VDTGAVVVGKMNIGSTAGNKQTLLL